MNKSELKRQANDQRARLKEQKRQIKRSDKARIHSKFKAQRKCFWTFPPGHVWEPHMDGALICAVCGKVKSSETKNLY